MYLETDIFFAGVQVEACYLGWTQNQNWHYHWSLNLRKLQQRIILAMQTYVIKQSFV